VELASQALFRISRKSVGGHLSKILLQFLCAECSVLEIAVTSTRYDLLYGEFINGVGIGLPKANQRHALTFVLGLMPLSSSRLDCAQVTFNFPSTFHQIIVGLQPKEEPLGHAEVAG
jgi:hypothetical protein